MSFSGVRRGKEGKKEHSIRGGYSLFYGGRPRGGGKQERGKKEPHCGFREEGKPSPFLAGTQKGGIVRLGSRQSSSLRRKETKVAVVTKNGASLYFDPRRSGKEGGERRFLT